MSSTAATRPGSLLLAALLALPAARAVAADERPTIVLIVVDTLRADHLGCYGYRKGTSPNLDSLAKRGAQFDRTVAQAPWTAPSVASLFTGKPPAGHGAIGSIEGRHPLLASDQVTLAEELHDAGYRTAAVITNPNIFAEMGFAQGFDVFEEKLLATATAVTDWGIAQLADDRAQPLFLYLHYMDPHSDYAPPGAYRARFAAGQPGRLGKVVRTEELHQINFGGLKPTPLELDYMVGLYDGEVAYADAEIGRFVEALERGHTLEAPTLLFRALGVGRRPAVLVVTADHGEEFFDHGGVFHGFTVYHELTHVPLIFVGPGIPESRVSHVTRLIDVSPTLFDLAGVQSTVAHSGASLRPSFHGGGKDRLALTQAEMKTQFRPVKFESIETSEWKFIRDDVAQSGQLYGVSNDPLEKVDLSQTQPQQAAELQELLDALLSAVPAAPPATAEVDAETKERLRQLGY